MPARYLVRLDDACPTMHHDRWEQVEKVLDRHGIYPLVAVIPDNQDPTFFLDLPDPNFWAKVRAWQAKGWAIGMHGYTHRMHPTRARKILPFYNQSEFSGLGLREQAEKIKKAQAILDAEQVKPAAFVAPGHCFDRVTLQAIQQETEIRVISDGIAADLYYNDGFFWVPQQLWRFKKRRFGLWTVLLHPNSMDDAALQQLESEIKNHARQIVSFSSLAWVSRRRNYRDFAVHARFWIGRRRPLAALRW